jgi:hypothetical protein
VNDRQSLEPLAEAEIAQTLTAIQTKLIPVEKSQPSEIEKVPFHPDWVSDTGEIIPLQGSWFSLYAREPGSEGSSEALDSEEASLRFIEQGDKNVMAALTALGFSESKPNFRQKPEEVVYRQRGFEKGDIKCLVNFSLMMEPYGDVLCGKYDPQQHEWRKELEPVINPDQDEDIQVDVTNVLGDYAIGNAHSRQGGGWYWILVRQDRTWEKVVEGQDVAPCSVIDQHKIPREIYGNCYDETTGKTRFEEFPGQNGP